MPGSTPIYGFPYPDPSDLVANYPSLGQDLAEDIEAVLPTIGGLVSTLPSTITNSGGSAAIVGNAVTFSNVNSVSLNGIFDSDFADYLITFNYQAANLTSTPVTVRLRNAGTDASGAGTYHDGSTFQYASTIGSTGNTGTAWLITSSAAGSSTDRAWINIFRPALAQFTGALGQSVCYQTDVTAYVGRTLNKVHLAASAYDGFSFRVDSSTISGSISVFGYRI